MRFKKIILFALCILKMCFLPLAYSAHSHNDVTLYKQDLSLLFIKGLGVMSIPLTAQAIYKKLSPRERVITIRDEGIALQGLPLVKWGAIKTIEDEKPLTGSSARTHISLDRPDGNDTGEAPPGASLSIERTNKHEETTVVLSNANRYPLFYKTIDFPYSAFIRLVKKYKALHENGSPLPTKPHFFYKAKITWFDVSLALAVTTVLIASALAINKEGTIVEMLKLTNTTLRVYGQGVGSFQDWDRSDIRRLRIDLRITTQKVFPLGGSFPIECLQVFFPPDKRYYTSINDRRFSHNQEYLYIPLSLIREHGYSVDMFKEMIIERCRNANGFAW